ncbi:UNVERIFIED_CONTAM: hypothetical protein FKN15_060292 [Acipenser sinensis]
MMANIQKCHACISCGRKLPPEHRHPLCVWCLGMQHASSALGDASFSEIYAAFQPRVLRSTLARFTGAASAAGSIEPSAALGARVSPILQVSQSPSQNIPCTEAPVAQAHSCSSSQKRSARQARQSKQAQDISDLKDQMAQVLEFVARHQAQPPLPAPAPPLIPTLELIQPLPVVTPDVSEADLAVAEENQDAISIAASWDGSPVPQEEEGVDTQELTFETGPSSETTLSSMLSPFSNLLASTHGTHGDLEGPDHHLPAWRLLTAESTRKDATALPVPVPPPPQTAPSAGSTSSPCRAPEGLRPQSHPFTQHQLHHWRDCSSDLPMYTPVTRFSFAQVLLPFEGSQLHP